MIEVLHIFKIPVLNRLIAAFLDKDLVKPEEHKLDFASELNKLKSNMNIDFTNIEPFDSKKQSLHILLTGRTGYLGSSSLIKLLSETDVKIHCLIRARNSEQARQRLIPSFDTFRLVLDHEFFFTYSFHSRKCIPFVIWSGWNCL